jgi:hypothetical protein
VVRVPAFQAGCRGFESRLPLHTNLVAMKNEAFHGRKSGLVAQGQSGRLITGWSQVRILPGPVRSKPEKIRCSPQVLLNSLFFFMPPISSGYPVEDGLILSEFWRCRSPS